DAVLISRGMLGQPWIVEDIKRLHDGLPTLVRHAEMHKEMLLEHLEYAMAYGSERKAVIAMHRVVCWYIKKTKGTKSLREAITHPQEISEIRNIIKALPVD